VREKGKESFVVPDSNLEGCGTDSTDKISFRMRILLTPLGLWNGRIMEFYLKNW